MHLSICSTWLWSTDEGESGREAGGREPKPMGNSLAATSTATAVATTVATTVAAAAVGKDAKSECCRCSQDFNGLVWLEADANPPPCSLVGAKLKFKVKYKQGNHLKVATCAQGSVSRREGHRQVGV